MKKDILNTVLCIGIMFLVGGCVMITVIIQSNSGTGRSPVVNNSAMDLRKGERSLIFAPKKEKHNKGFSIKQKKDSVNVVNTDLSGQKRSGLPEGSGGLQNAP